MTIGNGSGNGNDNGDCVGDYNNVGFGLLLTVANAYKELCE